MTQPQDKMRAEFEAWYIGRARRRIAKRLADWSDDEIRSGCMCPQSDGSYGIQSADDGWISWQGACAQQYAQSQQDALDAARWNCAMDWKNQKEFAVCKREGMHWTPINTSVPLDHHIAAQGASNV